MSVLPFFVVPVCRLQSGHFIIFMNLIHFQLAEHDRDKMMRSVRNGIILLTSDEDRHSEMYMADWILGENYIHRNRMLSLLKATQHSPNSVAVLLYIIFQILILLVHVIRVSLAAAVPSQSDFDLVWHTPICMLLRRGNCIRS